MLGLGQHLSGAYRTAFLSFREEGLSSAFVDRATAQGFEARSLKKDTPRLIGALRELERALRVLDAELLLTHGYKSDLLGLVAARRLGLPIIAVSHGWTWESFKVRAYEALDRLCLRWADRVVCVSEGQAAKVLRAGVPSERISVIRDAIQVRRFETKNPLYAERLREFFEGSTGPIVGAAGRLSPEKGFANLIEAARIVVRTNPSVRFVVFGEGRLWADLERRIAAAHLQNEFILAGFRSDLDQFIPHLDLLTLPSYTEGLPNVILEAFAGGVPVVATAVGGTPELVEHGVNGRLVPPGDPPALAREILQLLGDERHRRAMGQRGRDRVLSEFSFEGHAQSYRQIFEDLVASSSKANSAVARMI
jgi:glycosyltransferase involved in cell wall biosynthesis